MSDSVDKPRIVAVAGGKGGAGKSLIASNIGIFLATLGHRVVLVDAALGMANLHTFAGLARPERTLSEAFSKAEIPLDELVSITAVPGLRLVAGVRDPVWVATPKPAQVRRLATTIHELDADFVVIDLAPGTSSFTLDMFLAADIRVLVAMPEPTSIELCYRFIRAAFFRQLRAADLADPVKLGPGELRNFLGGIPAPRDLYFYALERDPELATAVEAQIVQFRPHLVINAVRSKADMEMGRAVASAVRRQLGVPITYLGHLEYDEAVWVAIRRQRPLLVEHPESRISKCIEKVTRRLLAVRDSDQPLDNAAAGDSHYDLLEVEPTASFEDIRRANRRVREVYSRDSVVVNGLYTDEQLDELHQRLDAAYSTLMDSNKRKAYDSELFPEGVPAQPVDPIVATPPKLQLPPAARPPMPTLTPATDFSGPLMRQIREARGIELRDISERTKIGMAYLEALESETFKKLPAVVYVRGFLVEYAKMLQIDTGRVLKTYLERYRVERQKIEAEADEWP
ncbi:MAG: helix-turn-helix domain-containing protein [Proteobacteria bacterium]|nr:helix-turn-helix domain-containing protein [Pseudomonadota bacterium]